MRTGIKIKKAYDDEDWKNYVIFVHGLKSSMKSVGINKLPGGRAAWKWPEKKKILIISIK